MTARADLAWVGSATSLLLDQWRDADRPMRARIEDELARSPIALAAFTEREPLVLSDGWRELFGGAVPPEVRALIDASLAAAAPMRLGAVAYRRPTDTGARTAEVVAAPGAKRTAVAIAYTREVDDQHRLLAMVSHELRTPVATLLMWEQLLRGHADDPQLRLRALDAIRASAVAQSRLVADLLDISRASSGKLHIDRERISLDEVLAAAIEAVAPAAAAKPVALSTRAHERLGKVRGDTTRLVQVFENLLTNAVKFTPAGGAITIDMRREHSWLVVEVGDTGIGITADLLPHVFEAFAQSASAPRGGLGLGLAIAREIVALHDGELTARSAGAGRGATFTVRLPPAIQRAITAEAT
ncbi:MAG: HAMP domain-containing histidine kinase [Deltaproteobacteria bacterium]|nr:HAMP domain-containing histidine kinase [Deltaproteobacteria bacterium]